LDRSGGAKEYINEEEDAPHHHGHLLIPWQLNGYIYTQNNKTVKQNQGQN